MLKRFVVFAVLIIAVAFVSPARADIRPVTIDDVLAASCSAYPPYPRRPEWIGDQDRLIVQPSTVCSEAPDSAGDAWIVVDLSDGSASRMAPGRFPHVSANGEWLAFVVDDDTGAVLKMRSMSTGDERNVHHFSAGPSRGYNFAMAWSPTGRRLAYAFQDAPSRPSWGDAAATAIVYGADNLPAGSQLHVYTLKTGSSEQLKSSSDRISGLAWADDRQLIVASFYLGHATGGGATHSRLESIDIEGRSDEILRDHAGELPLLMHPQMSPAGDLIAVEDYVGEKWLAQARTEIFDIAGRRVATIEGTLEGWSGDGNAIYVRRRDGAYDALYRVSLAGNAVRISREGVSARSIVVRGDGDRIAWVETDALGGRFVMTASPLGSSPSVAFDDSPAPADPGAAIVREICWTSRDDAHLCGLVIAPRSEANAREPRPLVVDVHGGPAGGLQIGINSLVLRTPLEWRLWTDRGYVVFVPEYRASGLGGVGPMLATRGRGTFQADNVRDIIAGVERLVEDGIADPNHMAIVGHSFGATTVNFLLTQTNRFRVAVSKEGLADLYHDSTFSDDLTEWLFEGPPWKRRQRYLNNSATFFAGDIETPTLFMSGADSGVPVYHNQFLYKTLRSRGIDAELIVYGGEGHAIRSAPNRRDVLERTLQWVDGHIR